MSRERKARIAGALAVSLLAMAVVAGCGRPASTGEPGGAPSGTEGFPVRLTDDASRTVEVDARAMRIVSLAPANTEIVDALGLFDRLVGVTTYDDYPAGVKKLPKMGDFTTPNLEAITAADPDLILVTGGVQADVLGKLEGQGAEVLVVDPKTLAGVQSAIGMVGAACGVPDKATEICRRMQDRVELVQEAVEGEERTSCFVEVGYDPLFTAGPDTLLDEMVRVAGGRNVVTQPGYVGYSVEQLLKDQPHAYLGTKSSLGDVASTGQRPGYARLDAVISGRVVALEDNWVSRPGPRIVDGLEQIARALHPERF